MHQYSDVYSVVNIRPHKSFKWLTVLTKALERFQIFILAFQRKMEKSFIPYFILQALV